MCIRDSSGTLEYDQKHYTLSAGDCVFLDCNKSYLHRCSNQLWTLEWAHFYGPNMPGIYEKYTERGGLACFRPQSLAPYQKILDSLCETASSSDYVRDMKIFEQLTACLLYTSNAPGKQRFKMHRYGHQMIQYRDPVV